MTSSTIDRGDRPAAESPGPESRRGRRSRRTPLQWAVVVAGVVLVMALVIVGGTIALAEWRFRSIEKVDLNLVQGDIAQAPLNILIVGSDSREDSEDPPAPDTPIGQRADGIIVARLQPDGRRVDLLSIPRDLWVPIAGTSGEQRINTAYNEGPQVLVDTIRENFGIEINHYVEITFNGFLGLVDSVGGVNVYFPNRVRDRQLGFEIGSVGCHPLVGPSALAFARSRHLEWSDERRWITDPTADLGRIARQQLLLRRAVQKLGTLGLGDVGAANRLVGVAVNHVRLDDGFRFDELVALGRRFANLGPDGLVEDTLPVVPHTTPGGAQVVLLAEADAGPVLAKYRAGTAASNGAPAPLVPAMVRVSVWNGTGISGHAASTLDRFALAGFATGDPADAGVPVGRTIVRYGPEGSRAAALVAKHLEADPSFELDDSMSGSDVLVITGADLSAVQVDVPAGRPPVSTPTDDAARSNFGVSPLRPVATTSAAPGAPAETVDPVPTTTIPEAGGAAVPEGAYLPEQPTDGTCPP